MLNPKIHVVRAGVNAGRGLVALESIKAGETVALVGTSGGGKSTLVQVMLGLYPAERGEICFNQVPVSRIGFATVRRHVVTVLQRPALLNDSVRGNLTLGRTAPDSKLWQALEIACLDDVVHRLDGGLNARIGRQGVRFSGGQRQRLAIARMVLADPSVVILDEATSALDSETERQVHANLQAFLAGRTTIIVAHRLSAVRLANRAFVFEGGQLAETGTHDDLVARDGLYARLYSQLQ